MSLSRKFVPWCVLCLSMSMLAQTDRIREAHRPGKSTPATVIRHASAQDALEGDERAALVTTALQQRRRADAKLDCSHLVHTIYSRAGYPYLYAKSADLYVGVEPFHRVARPAPGDLVVWRGHAGLVIDPVQHSFFSKLRSGLGVDFYDAPYWKRRGTPHFFRYQTENARAGMTAVARANDRKPTNHPAPQLIATSTHADSLPVAVNNNEREQNPARAALEGNLVVKASKPSSEQLRTAILSKFSENGEKLQALNVFELSQPFTVVESVEIKKIHIKGDGGWIDVRINASSSIIEGRPDFKKRSEHQRWGLVRFEPDTWEIALPPETMYVPRDIAAQLFAQQLANLTQSAPGSTAAGQKAELARFLNALLVH
jgi:NlpC/P60 family